MQSSLKIAAVLIAVAVVALLAGMASVHPTYAFIGKLGLFITVGCATLLVLGMLGSESLVPAAQRPPNEPPLPAFPGERPPWIHSTAWAQHTDPSRYPMGRPTLELGTEHDLAPMPESRVRIETECTVPVLDDLEEALANTPAIIGVWNPGLWPVCCGRIAVLMSIEPTPEEAASMAFREGEWSQLPAVADEDQNTTVAARATVDHAPELSLAVFACSVCGQAAADITHT